MKLRGQTAVLTILILGLALLPEFFVMAHHPIENHLPRSLDGAQGAPLVSNSPFDFVLIILMENKNFSQIYGSALAPYLNHLADNYSLARQYTACDHPSLPNYMCLTGGNNYFSGNDCSPIGYCTTSNSSIVDRVENAGLTWTAYLEDMPSACYKGAAGNYTFLTNPFIFSTSITNNSTRCATHVVPANSGGKGPPDDNLLSALSSTSTASNYMWLTPNLCDNMHNCSISRGDSYLSKLVPSILNSFVFKTQKVALFITFDEGFGRYPTDYVYTVWAGPAVKNHYESAKQYSHYSLPSTIEIAWGLQPLTEKDRGSLPMMEFFLSPLSPSPPLGASFTFSPSNPDQTQVVNFSGFAFGGAKPYSYKWSFGDGDQGAGKNIVHAYLHTGVFTAKLTISDASGQVVTASEAIPIDSDLSPDGTCEGCGKITSPRTMELAISFAVGFAMPLLGSLVMSRKRRKSGRNAPPQ